MLYLLDANVLIDAHRDYYPRDRVPEFWQWLLYQCKSGKVKIPTEIYDEVVPPAATKGDKLIKWMKKNRSSVELPEIARQVAVDRIIQSHYVQNPSSSDLVKMGNDPYLISYAYAQSQERTIVTTERSKPSVHGANRKIPDVCSKLGVDCIHTFRLIRDLNFQTGWKRKS